MCEYLRILKLVRFLPNLRRQLVVMLRTMDNVAVFFALLMLFIFIFRFAAIIWKYIFAYELEDRDRHTFLPQHPRNESIRMQVLRRKAEGPKSRRSGLRQKELRHATVGHRHRLSGDNLCSSRQPTGLLVVVYYVHISQDLLYLTRNPMIKLRGQFGSRSRATLDTYQSRFLCMRRS